MLRNIAAFLLMYFSWNRFEKDWKAASMFLHTWTQAKAGWRWKRFAFPWRPVLIQRNIWYKDLTGCSATRFVRGWKLKLM